MSDDFCLVHGYEHMRSQFGNPIPYCAQCERERLCPCERKGAVDPWCHAAGMCVDEPEARP